MVDEMRREVERQITAKNLRREESDRKVRHYKGREQACNDEYIFCSGRADLFSITSYGLLTFTTY